VLETLVVVASATGLYVLAKNSRGQQTFQVNPVLVATFADKGGEDLPCPWCYGPTDETDVRCRGCGRKFG
jgi:hypothetical protein